MGSMLDTIGAFIIGSLVILGLMGLDVSTKRTSFETTSNGIAQEATEEVISMIRSDFSKMGHRVPFPTPQIISCSTNGIIFRADIDNDGTPEQIQYSLSDSTAVPSTQNPSDCFLYRTINGAEPKGTALGITEFQLRYFDENGNITTSVSSIRSIEVKLVIESLYPSDGTYPRSEKLFRITPMPLRL